MEHLITKDVKNYNKILKEINENLQYFGSKNQNTMGAFHHFINQSLEDGFLSKKQRN